VDHASLLAAIRAAPDDDAPRLVYADWLIERGDPRGELIQVQCALARRPDDATLAARQRVLLTRHRAAWTQHLPIWARESATFERGFVTSCVVPDEARLLAGEDALRAAWPPLTLRPGNDARQFVLADTGPRALRVDESGDAWYSAWYVDFAIQVIDVARNERLLETGRRAGSSGSTDISGYREAHLSADGRVLTIRHHDAPDEHLDVPDPAGPRPR
jgi:uncharacterized protein (TIGR02996 family)